MEALKSAAFTLIVIISFVLGMIVDVHNDNKIKKYNSFEKDMEIEDESKN